MAEGQNVSVPSNGEFLKAKVELAIKRVMRNYLIVLEEITDQHDEAMNKLIDALPPEHQAKVILADHFTDAKFEATRRRILNVGNDAIREIQEQVDNLRIK